MTYRMSDHAICQSLIASHTHAYVIYNLGLDKIINDNLTLKKVTFIRSITFIISLNKSEMCSDCKGIKCYKMQ